MTQDKYPAVEDRGDMIILRGELGEQVIYDVLSCADKAEKELFESLFELDKTEYLGDPNDSFYQVIQFTRIITRKSDGKKFGAGYCSSPGNDSMEGYADDIAEQVLGELPYDPDTYMTLGGTHVVFLPVKEFTRVGYEVVMPGE